MSRYVTIALLLAEVCCANVIIYESDVSNRTFEKEFGKRAHVLLGDEELDPPELDSIHQRSRRSISKEVVKMPSGQSFSITSGIIRNGRCGIKSRPKYIRLFKHGRMGRREYEIVSNEMTRTKIDLPNCATKGGCFKRFKIIKIHKVANGCLWNRYKERREEIMLDTKATNANERMLFFGSDKVWQISKIGFDERLSTGGSFGAGLYFTEHSSVAVNYENKECATCNRKMILSRVILGKEFKKDGSGTYAHAPVGHHSVVGKQTGNTYNEYVVYRGEQAYPEYVITYKLVM